MAHSCTLLGQFVLVKNKLAYGGCIVAHRKDQFLRLKKVTDLEIDIYSNTPLFNKYTCMSQYQQLLSRTHRL